MAGMRYVLKDVSTGTESNYHFKGVTKVFYAGKGVKVLGNEYKVSELEKYGYTTLRGARNGLKNLDECDEYFDGAHGLWVHETSIVKVVWDDDCNVIEEEVA